MEHTNIFEKNSLTILKYKNMEAITTFRKTYDKQLGERATLTELFLNYFTKDVEKIMFFSTGAYMDTNYGLIVKKDGIFWLIETYIGSCDGCLGNMDVEDCINNIDNRCTFSTSIDDLLELPKKDEDFHIIYDYIKGIKDYPLAF